jgi:hypothetical protein
MLKFHLQALVINNIIPMVFYERNSKCATTTVEGIHRNL